MVSKVRFAGFEVVSNRLCIVCVDVFERTKPPLIVIHEHDATYQVVCGGVHETPGEYRVVGFGHVVERLPNEQALPMLRPGELAELIDGDWEVSPLLPDGHSV